MKAEVVLVFVACVFLATPCCVFAANNTHGLIGHWTFDNLADGIFSDSTSNLYRLIRVSYPVSSAQQKILDAGLPPILAHRLNAGM